MPHLYPRRALKVADPGGEEHIAGRRDLLFCQKLFVSARERPNRHQAAAPMAYIITSIGSAVLLESTIGMITSNTTAA